MNNLKALCKDKRYIVFGTGNIAKELIKQFPLEHIDFFCDNDEKNTESFLMESV